MTLVHPRSYKTAAIWRARRAQRSSTGLVDGRNDGPRTRPALAALLFVVSLAVALGVAEIGARMVAPFFLFDGEIAFSRGPYRGHEGVPMETRDGVVMWRFPRDDRPAPRPVKQGFRIVVLGDSVLFPALVSDAHGAARRLETLLNEHLDGGPYEVVNLAEPGFDTQQEERMLLEAGFPLAPDLVLVGVTPNDQQEFALHDGELLEVRFLHHMRARHDAGWLGRLTHESYFYNWMWLLLERVRTEPVDDPDAVIVGPLRRMHEGARERNARFAVMCFPGYGATEHLDPRRDRCAFPGVGAWAAEAAVPYLDLVDAEVPYRVRDISMDHIHRSAYGHEIDAVAIFDWLVDQRVVPYRAIRSRPEPPPQK